MKLTELFTNNKQIDGSGKTFQQPIVNNTAINRQINALKPGQTLQGEVIAKNGGEVQIKVAEDFVIKARVDQNINLEIGKQMTFEVKNNGQSLTLLPLYTNTAMDANVLRALDMAALPVNADTVAMTEQMMQAGLSIDRNSLQQVFRECNMYPESNVSDIIDLHKLSLPVNAENLQQISSYKNLTHQMVNGLNEVVNALPDTMQNMVQNGNVEGAARLFWDVLNLVSGTVGEQGVLGEQNTNSGMQADLQQLLDLLANVKVTEETEGAVQNPMIQDGEEPNPMLQNGPIHSLGNSEQLPSEQMLRGQIISERPLSEQTVQGQPLSGPEPSGKPLLSEQTIQEQTVTGQTIPQSAAQEPGLQNQAMDLLQRLLQHGIGSKDTALLRELMGNKEVRNLLKDSLQNLWTIQPEDVADAEKVEQLYRRLDKQLKGLTQALENANQTHSEVYRTTTNLSGNLDFLQQINQTYTYLQLPLRLQQGNNAHGDLYVYSNKKHLASPDGKITAFLHLDMENLGPLDVYVAMQNEKVSTKFYVQDEVMDFLEDHMELLTERLRKRGYDCNCEMVKRDSEGGKTGDFVNRLLEKETQIPIVQYAFDVRT